MLQAKDQEGNNLKIGDLVYYSNKHESKRYNQGTNIMIGKVASILSKNSIELRQKSGGWNQTTIRNSKATVLKKRAK